jgi:anti-anti-sigma regulatory factor
MEIDHKVENGIINIAIKGRLDAATSPAAEESINLSSGGLRVILGASKEIRRREGKVALCCLNQYVNEIFEVSGFSAMIPIKDTVAEGLKELA